jgi:GT2 family glycosyltransferase
VDISVIVPVYNGERLIADCLAQLTRQAAEVGSVEIIVVDDCSNDRTVEVAHRYHSVKVVQHTRNVGPAAARNTGVENAVGNIILFTDADCVPGDNWIAEMTAPFYRDARVVGVKGVYRTRQSELAARFVQLEYQDKYDKMRGTETIDFIDTYSAGYRRNVFLEFGGFDCRFPVACAEDVELSFRMAKRGYRMVFAEGAHVYHRHPSTWQDYVRKKYKFAYWRAVAARLHPSKALKDSHTPIAQRLQLLLVPAGLLMCAGIPLSPVFGWVGVGGLFVASLSMMPFIYKSMPKDWLAACSAPAFLFPRALVQCVAVCSSLGERLPIPGSPMKINEGDPVALGKG